MRLAATMRGTKPEGGEGGLVFEVGCGGEPDDEHAHGGHEGGAEEAEPDGAAGSA